MLRLLGRIRGYAASVIDLEGESTQRSARRRKLSDHSWLERGANHRWGWLQVAVALVGLAVGLLLLRLLSARAHSPWGYFAADSALWAALLLSVAVGFLVSVPRGLFHWRWRDLVIGLFAGISLRMIVDGLHWREQGFLDWLTFADPKGEVPTAWWLDGIVATAIGAPVVEELFYRAFLLVALYTVFRRFTGSPAVAAVATVCINASVFMFSHVIASAQTMSNLSAIAILLVGITTATLVLLTGRFWSALITHLTFNGLWVLLALIGTYAGVTGSYMSLT